MEGAGRGFQIKGSRFKRALVEGQSAASGVG